MVEETPSLVRDLMTVGVDTCKTDTGVLDLARLMLQKNLEAVVVLDEDGCAQGVVSLDELSRLYSRFSEGGQAALEGLTAAAIMREGVPQVPPDIPLIRGCADDVRPGCAGGILDAPCRRYRIPGRGADLHSPDPSHDGQRRI